MDAAARNARNKELVRRFVDAGNARDYETLETIVSSTVRRYCQATPDVNVESFDDFRRFLELDASACPDNRVELDTLIAEGDQVAVWATFTGTQTGPMGPFPPSGKRMVVEVGAVFRIEDGRIAEVRLTWDNVAALTQLGHLPPPGAVPDPRA